MIIFLIVRRIRLSCTYELNPPYFAPLSFGANPVQPKRTINYPPRPAPAQKQVYRFLLKPCNGLDLLITIRRALEHKAVLEKTNQLLKAGDYQLLLLQKLTNDHSDIVQTAKDTLETIVWDEPQKRYRYPHK